MEAGEGNPLEAAERRARASRKLSEEADRRQEAEEAEVAEAASQAADQLVVQFFERLAGAGWPPGKTVSALESVLEPTGVFRKSQERRRLVEHEVWAAPIGVGYGTSTGIGSMLNGEWARVYKDSQIAIDRDGTFWHGAYSTEKAHRSWSKLPPPANQAQVEAITATLGAILAEHIPDK